MCRRRRCQTVARKPEFRSRVGGVTGIRIVVAIAFADTMQKHDNMRMKLLRDLLGSAEHRGVQVQLPLIAARQPISIHQPRSRPGRKLPSLGKVTPGA